MIDGLLGVKTVEGQVLFFCKKCQQVAEAATGATDKADLVYMLICPNCQHTLGEWITQAEQDAELRAFREKVLRGT